MRVGIVVAVAAFCLSLGGPAWCEVGSSATPPPTLQPPSSAAPAAVEASPPPHHLDRCPDNLGDFENSDATKDLVQKCLGQPERVMPGRGSDVIWFYSAKAGAITLVMVFDKSGALTHFRAYAHS